MSNRRRRKQEHSNSGGGEATAARDPFLRRYSEFLWMALALSAGAIFLALIQRPTSFYSAVQKAEWSAYNERPAPGAFLLHRGREGLIRSIQETLNRGDIARQRDSLEAMLRAVVASEGGPIDAASAMDAKLKDSHNDLTSLVAAMVLTAPDERPQPSQPLTAEGARVQFQKMSTILELTPPSGTASTYNREIRAVLHAAYRGYFSRPEVAMIIADAEGAFLIRSHLTAFPIMHRRLSALATALDAAGDPHEAEQCRQWFRRVMWEVIESEPDVPTRLLCIDLLMSDLSAGASGRKALMELRDAFVDHAAAAPMDRADPSGARSAVAPEAYRSTQAWLMAAVALGLAAAGAAGAYALSLVLSPFMGSQKEMTERTRQSQVVHWLIAQGLILLSVYVVVGTATPRGPFSDHWALHMSILAALIGFNTGVGFSGFHDRPFELPWGTRLALIVPMAPMVLVFAPPEWIVVFSRWADRWMHPMWAGLLIAAAGAFLSFVLNIRRLRGIRRTAAMICGTTAFLALAAYAVHASADARWMQAAARGREDEFSARLGSQWFEQRLSPLKRELLGGQP